MSAPGEPGGAAPDGRWVVFRAGGERFGLPLAAVWEVVLPQPPFARVPRTGAAVRGAMNLRGRVVPVVDLASLLGLDAPRLSDADGQVVVLEGARPGLGLHVSGVVGVEHLASEGGMAGAPASPAAAGAALAPSRGGAVTLLDPRAIASAAEAHFGAPERRALP